MTLDECIARTKLPIKVGTWEAPAGRLGRPFYGVLVNGEHYLFPGGAKTVYLQAVKDLTRSDRDD